MKKLSRSLAACSVLMMLVVFIIGCQKDLQPSSNRDFNYNVKTPFDETLKFTDLSSVAKVNDGVLVFQKYEDLNKVIHFLRRANPTEIEKWESSLIGFTSIFKNYENTMNEFDGTSESFETLKSKYQNKVDFKANNTILPIVDNGNAFGRIIGEKQYYILDGAIVLYHLDNVISITDGDVSKIALAKNTLVTDAKQNIFVHGLKVDNNKSNSGTVEPRAVKTIILCPNSCPQFLSSQSVLNAPSNNVRLTCNSGLVNNSSNTSTTINFDVVVNCKVFKDKKQLFWWTGDASGFNWGFGWDITVKSYYGDIFQNTSTQAGGWTWNQFSKSLIVDVVIGRGTVNRDQNNMFDFDLTVSQGVNVCIKREGIQCRTFDNSIVIERPDQGVYCEH
jgi:hypothetical protein